MSQILDHGPARTIADAINDLLDDLGYSPGENIPGLLQTILDQADMFDHRGEYHQSLDEAMDVLSDGSLDDERES